MNPLESSQRAAVVAEARSWLRTPYHHMGRVKGAGTDCAQLIACVYRAAGLIPEIPLEYYPQDWHLHRGIERYLDRVLDHARTAAAPQPGDLVLWRWGRCYAHGAIVAAWPSVVHAMIRVGVLEEDVERNSAFLDRPRKFFTLW